MRIRTIKSAIEELKKEDINCQLTENALRRMVKENQIPYSRSGTRILIDIDRLYVELPAKENTLEKNHIRRVEI